MPAASSSLPMPSYGNKRYLLDNTNCVPAVEKERPSITQYMGGTARNTQPITQITVFRAFKILPNSKYIYVTGYTCGQNYRSVKFSVAK
jgi:hypothetical protein